MHMQDRKTLWDVAAAGPLAGRVQNSTPCLGQPCCSCSPSLAHRPFMIACLSKCCLPSCRLPAQCVLTPSGPNTKPCRGGPSRCSGELKIFLVSVLAPALASVLTAAWAITATAAMDSVVLLPLQPAALASATGMTEWIKSGFRNEDMGLCVLLLPIKFDICCAFAHCMPSSLVDIWGG